jgi:hypothetical protein
MPLSRPVALLLLIRIRSGLLLILVMQASIIMLANVISHCQVLPVILLEFSMNDEDLKPLLSSLLEHIRFLAQETASLIDDRADRSHPDAANGIRERASEIRASADAIGALASKVLK